MVVDRWVGWLVDMLVVVVVVIEMMVWLVVAMEFVHLCFAVCGGDDHMFRDLVCHASHGWYRYQSSMNQP